MPISRRVPLFIILMGTVLAVAVLYGIGILNPVQEALRWALSPLANLSAVIGTRLGHDAAGNVATLRAQVRDYEDRLAAFSVDYVKLRSLEEENRQLRVMAKFLSSTGYDHIGARVIARHIQGKSAAVLIDRGSDDGLEKGMAVIVGDGVLVGKITLLNRRLATVTLISDERSRVAAAPLGSNKLFGMVEGLGNGISRLTLVPQSEPLKRNDIVVTAGTEEKIPANLAIALVDEVKGQPTDPFKTATLLPLARLDQLSLVTILRPAALRPVTDPQNYAHP
jgi:rod shape-determining protein MreC